MSTKTWAEKLGLTEEEYKAVKRAAWGTWEYIASDLLSCSEQSRLRRGEVMECVLDANRMTSMNSWLPDKVKKLLDSYSHPWYDVLEKALKAEVFTDQWYS